MFQPQWHNLCTKQKEMISSLNITKKQTGFLTIILAALISLSPFAIDTYAPAMSFMATSFHTKYSNIELSMTIYISAYALGQFLGGPLSDHFGRKPIVTIGLILFILSSFALTQINSIQELYIYRFIQAIGGGFSVVVAMAIVRDIFSDDQLTKQISYISVCMMLAPLLAPSIGTFLLNSFGWRTIFGFLSVYAVLVFSIICITIPETKIKQQPRKSILRSAIENYTYILKKKQVIDIILTSAFGFAGMFTFVTGSSFIYIQHFKKSIEIYPLLFGANVLLTIILSMMNTQLINIYQSKTILQWGIKIQLIAGTILFISMLFISPPFILVFVCIVIYVGIMGIIFSNANAIVLQIYPDSSGTTMAVIGIAEFTTASIIGYCLHFIQNDTLIPYGIMLFLCSLLSNLFYHRSNNF